MIDYRILKDLVMEAFQAKPNLLIRDVVPDVERLAAEKNILPARERKSVSRVGLERYSGRRLTAIDRAHVTQIIWQMVRENLMVIGADRNN
ncbi:MAG: hypothetical protein ACOY90_05900 [Candidatus Zhuqueibacterota bacterium]